MLSSFSLFYNKSLKNVINTHFQKTSKQKAILLPNRWYHNAHSWLVIEFKLLLLRTASGKINRFYPAEKKCLPKAPQKHGFMDDKQLMQFSLNGLHTRRKSWSRNLPMEAFILAFKTITDEVISECVVWCQLLFWSALHNTSTLKLFQPVSVLSLLISSPLISLLAIILSSVTSLFNNCVVSSNTKHNPTSGPCVT